MKLKTEFESLEDAIAYLKGEAADGVADQQRQIEATDRKNKELLAEKKTLTEKFKKFEGYEDVDLDDLKRRAEAAEDTGDVEAKYQKAYEQDKAKCSDPQN